MKKQVQTPVKMQELVKNTSGIVNVLTNPLSLIKKDTINKLMFGGN